MADIELGCVYQVFTPDQGKKFTLNSPYDADFVGYIDDVTGLDDTEIRESAQNVVAGDGGIHGPFWRGRRPWTISGIIIPTTPVTARSAAQRKINAVMSQCLRADGYLAWYPSDMNGGSKFLRFRQQQPVRFTPGQAKIVKNFLVAGVAADWRIYTGGASKIINVAGVANVGTPAFTQNSGDAEAPFRAVITGPADYPVLGCSTTGKSFRLNAAGLIPAGMTATLDTTGSYPTFFRADGQDLMGYVDITVTDWSLAVPVGTGSWTLTGSGFTAATAYSISWNDAWL